MRNRAVRVALLLLVVLGIGAAGYELTLLEQQSEAAAQARRLFDEKARHAETAVRELRASQFAYVAAGQDSSFWVSRARTLMPAIAADVKSLCDMDAAAATSARSICSRGQDAIATIQRIDTSVGGYLESDQRLLASDLVFTDLREANQALAAWIDQVRQRRADADRAADATLQKRRVATAAGAAMFALLVLILLAPVGQGVPAPADGSAREARTFLGDIAHAARPAPPEAAADLSLNDSPSEAPAAAPPPWPPAPGAPGETAASGIDLAAAAALCTDLACVNDSKDLGPLLAHVASLLDAAGVIVWVEDAAIGLLRPALSYGYSQHALARIDGIAKDADNATASACRDRRLRVVRGDGSSSGALAAPLLWSNGCLGVMTAEVRHGRERDAATQAVATMIAAQLSTLVMPQPARHNQAGA